MPGDSVVACDITLPLETVENDVSVAEMRVEVELQKTRVEEHMTLLIKQKAEGKVKLRTFQSVDGALENLLRLGALHTVGIDPDLARSIDEMDDQVADKRDAFRSSKAAGNIFSRRQKDKIKLMSAVSESFDLNANQVRPLFTGANDERLAREQRRVSRQELCVAEGRLMVLSTLQQSELGRAEVRANQHSATGGWGHSSASAKGRKQLPIDIRWNMNLPPLETDGSAQPAAETMCKLCYYCASLQEPIRASHNLLDCPKRRKAGAREFTQEAMAYLRADLAKRRAEAEGILRQFPHAADTDSKGSRGDDKKHLISLSTPAAKHARRPQSLNQLLCRANSLNQLLCRTKSLGP